MNINATIIGQIIWFALFVWFTMKVVWPALNSMIEQRQKTIADGLAAGERGKQELELSANRTGEALRESRERSAEIIAQAEKRVSQMIEEAKTAAKEESSREKAAAQAEIDQQYSRAKEALREQISALAIAGAEKILRREVDARAHADLLDQMKKEF